MTDHTPSTLRNAANLYGIAQPSDDPWLNEHIAAWEADLEDSDEYARLWHRDALALAQQTARVEALERAVVTLYDDISDHVPDDVLVLVTECRAALAADKTELPAAEDD